MQIGHMLDHAYWSTGYWSKLVSFALDPHKYLEDNGDEYFLKHYFRDHIYSFYLNLTNLTYEYLEDRGGE